VAIILYMENFGTEFSAMIEEHFGLKISKAVTFAIVLIIFATAVDVTAPIIAHIFHYILEIRSNGILGNNSLERFIAAIYTGLISFGVYLVLIAVSHSYIVKYGNNKIDKMKEKALKEMRVDSGFIDPEPQPQMSSSEQLAMQITHCLVYAGLLSCLLSQRLGAA